MKLFNFNIPYILLISGTDANIYIDNEEYRP